MKNLNKFMEEVNKGEKKSKKENREIASRWLVFFATVLVLFVCNVSVDPLNLRAMNNYEIHNTVSGEEYKLIDMIKNQGRYKDTPYDYGKAIRKETTIIIADGKITEISENANDRVNIIMSIPYDYLGESKKFSVWLKDETKMDYSKYQKGSEISFKGELNNINGSYVIISEGEILND